MYRECFLYSSEKISSKPKPNMIYLHSDNSKIFICNQIPFFAYFQIPIKFQKEWTFYANNTKIEIKIDDSISVPFYKLQNLLDKSANIKDKEFSSTNTEISRALCKSLDLWLHSNDEDLIDDDIIIFFKIISTNFSFNHFSSVYKKMHPDNNQKSYDLSLSDDQIEVNFKKFLLSVRPNGKPNSHPLFTFSTSFLMFLHQLKYSDFFFNHQKFVTCGIHYILDYLHNDNEWGPYSALLFLSHQLEINHIHSYPLNDYNIELNPDFFFDKENLKCIEACASIFGELSLLWCYNPCFHKDFVDIAKNAFENSRRKINQKDLFEIILRRICHEKDNELDNTNLNDYSSFYKFVQIISPETDNKLIFSRIYQMYFSNDSAEPTQIPFKFKIFYENEIIGKMNKGPEKLHWRNVIEEQRLLNLNQDVLNDEIDDIEDTDINHICLIKNEINKFEEQNDKETYDILSMPVQQNMNFHHIIFSDFLSNDDMGRGKSSIDDELLENFEQRPIMQERFGEVDARFIKRPEIQQGNKENENSTFFDFNKMSEDDLILDDKLKTTIKVINNKSSKDQNSKKSRKESKQSKTIFNNSEKSFSII